MGYMGYGWILRGRMIPKKTLRISGENIWTHEKIRPDWSFIVVCWSDLAQNGLFMEIPERGTRLCQSPSPQSLGPGWSVTSHPDGNGRKLNSGNKMFRYCQNTSNYVKRCQNMFKFNLAKYYHDLKLKWVHSPLGRHSQIFWGVTVFILLFGYMPFSGNEDLSDLHLWFRPRSWRLQ